MVESGVRALSALIFAAASCAMPTAAAALDRPVGTVITPPLIGAVPAAASSASSDDAAFSQDNRDVRLVAYDSYADNLVPGDTNHRRDVFLLRKTPGAGQTGGPLSRVSVSTGGAQANGDSARPSVDGTTHWYPRCVAFQSIATNLAPGDRSPDVDIFLRDLHRHKTLLVSVGRTNADQPSIDGRCRYVSFQSNGWIWMRDIRARHTLRVAPGANPDQQTDGRGVAYDRDGQVYYQAFRTGNRRLSKRGAERLVSAGPGGFPGDGLSSRPAIDDRGYHVAFESTATNLCVQICGLPYHAPPDAGSLDPGDIPGGRDANGSVSDIYRANLQVPPGAAGSMTLVSYDIGGSQLDGPSYHPAISRAGRQVLFESSATNAGRVSGFGENAGVYTSVFSWYDSGSTPGGGQLHVESFGWPSTLFNGPSWNPAVSSRGNYIAYTTAETGYGGEVNGPAVPDVLLAFVGPESHGLPTN
jgi:hypothetical protein